MAEDFEGAFPPTGCFVDDTSPTDGGEYLWGKRGCRALSGNYSIWAGAGGSDGQNQPCGETYADNLQTWLICGPFDLSEATDAELQFALWADLEGSITNHIDTVRWGAAPDFHFGNYSISGQTGSWVPFNMWRSDVPFHGDLTGQSEVYLDWLFGSDESNSVPHEGAFVDDTALWVYIPPSPTLPSPPVTSPITRHTTLKDFAVGNSYDGTMLAVQYGDGALALAAQTEAVGAWDRLPSLPKPLIAFAAVTAQGHLFIAGGNSSVDDSNPDSSIQQRVYSAPIGGDGRLGLWQETTILKQ